jgi:hypothetical protein
MRRVHLLLMVAVAMAATALFGGISASSSATPGSAVLVTRQVPEKPVTTVGEVFLRKTLTINYTGGTVTMAGDPGGTAQVDTDDILTIRITHLADGTHAKYVHDYSDNCQNSSDVPTNPVDLSSLLKTGQNTISFVFADKCGGVNGVWETWLTLP